jgi:hypothetical protein
LKDIRMSLDTRSTLALQAGELLRFGSKNDGSQLIFLKTLDSFLRAIYQC